MRTPVHTAARELNPFAAPAQIQGIFHPTYLALHQETQRLLDQPCAVTFKGGGGEGQRNPDKPCRTAWVRQGRCFEEVWPAIEQDADPWPWRAEEQLDPGRLAAMWAGEWSAPGPTAAVIGTTALCLRLLDRTDDAQAAQATAETMWSERRLERAA